MFSTAERLRLRQGASGTPRPSYLQQLTDEAQGSVAVERRREVVARLANLAYDPINYPTMRGLNVVDLFLGADANADGAAATHKKRATDCMADTDSQLREFGAAGLCNVASGTPSICPRVHARSCAAQIP